MSSIIGYKDKILLKCGISLLYTLGDKMFDVALADGHLSSEPIVIFISSMQTSWYYSLDRFSVEEIKLFLKWAIQAIEQLDKEGYFDLEQEEIEDRIKNNIPLYLPRGDKLQALEFIKNLQDLIYELEAERDV